MKARKRVSITKGGCDRCPARWQGSNAHMLAGKHNKQTGHPTWSHTTGALRQRHGTAAQQERLL